MPTAIGKKRKRKIVYRERKKSLLVPVLLVGGLVAYYLITKNKTEAVTVTDPGAIDYNSGTGDTIYVPPTSVTVTPGANLPALDSAAESERLVLLRDATKYPEILAAIKIMNSAEINTTYQYFYTYFLTGQPIYSGPVQKPDGTWDLTKSYNPQLYAAVIALQTKYGIFK